MNREAHDRASRAARHHRKAKKAYEAIYPKLIAGNWDADEVIDVLTAAIAEAVASDRERIAAWFEGTHDLYDGKAVAGFIRMKAR
jgi:hypothetical protein